MVLCFKVITLNCWGFIVLSEHRKSRMVAIAEVLASNQFDVVCLQEVWVIEDFNLIKEKVSKVLPYSHYFYSAVVGSGICILTKHPIEDTYFHQFSVNGYVHKIQHGDWWTGKGVGLCRVRVEHGTDCYYVNVYTTHFHAEYNRACETDEYLTHRVIQAFETAQFIKFTSGTSDFSIMAGDLNTHLGHIVYRIIVTVAQLSDSYVQAGNVSQDLFATFYNYKNSYTPPHVVKQTPVGQRLDYVMYRQNSTVKIDVKSYNLPLSERVPNQSHSYSDHEAVLVELIIKRDCSVNNRPEEAERKQALEEGIALCNEALLNIFAAQIQHLLSTLLLLLFLIASFIIPAVITTPFCDEHPNIISILRILTALIIFFLLMATVWSRIDKHCVLSGKLAMEASLNKTQKIIKNI